MKILFTICGRAGSKGVKNKNIRDFLGVPLPLYTTSAIELYLEKNAECDIDIAVNTDSPELIEIIHKSQLKDFVFIERKEYLGNDYAPKKSVIADTYLEMKKKKHDYDMVIDLDLTSPLRTVNDINNLVKKMEQTGSDVVFSVTDSRRNPYFNMVKKNLKGYSGVIQSNFTARQQAPETYDMNASMYAYNPVFLISEKGVLDGYCEVVKMFDTGVLDIDHEHDFELMQIIAQYMYEKYPEYREIRSRIECLAY